MVLRLKNPFDKASYGNVPSTAGVYIYKHNNEYLYIGKSVNIRARMYSHLENARVDDKEHAVISQTTKILIIPTDTEFNALLLESRLIQRHLPKYNVIWRDDKSYLYVKVTVGEIYPKISIVRKENDGVSKYFGPFSATGEVERMLRAIRKLVPYCTQKRLTKRPCFYSKIGLCNPCPNYVESLNEVESMDSPSDSGGGNDKKNKLKRLYRTNIRKIIRILSGQTLFLLNSLYRELESAKASQDYEKAISIRSKIHFFEYLIHFRSFRQETHTYNASTDQLSDLQTQLSPYFKDISPLERIECYDISNLGMSNATASMVVLSEGVADKGEYRKFKIKSETARSDFERLEEVIERRLHNDWKLPNLIVIDGGRPQIRVVARVIQKANKSIPLIGIAKNPDRLIVNAVSLPALPINPQSGGYRLIQLIRDESHRFAKKYHTYLRSPIKKSPISNIK
ncbi:hypothetical protein COY90_03665 [Candidatus Roizmanbacteria bacterium CG_4_10_14_0_8_um_filter_39_9]|uniref:Excinuclease ABC subunit C n=1 Tax=Candidatus Roizmanbacteria bacterium CG_4_10_14_0_8_um_filter_39_9 TaxID=1974829 RepID=A0A2M7QDM1_9BACT|nr:MAG: hypothetical protein COY90_03665 [Candidatus Roizmanbacteria bacterium CG_4_10_14_0_8_um_filter_39_9]